jgi:hypothetical protein
MISNTEMRLAEVVGLHTNDIILGDVPYVCVKPQAWRSLKTTSSKRKIPLVGTSLWASQRIKSMSNSYGFPRYEDGL